MATSTEVPIYTNTLTSAASSVVIDVSNYQQYTNLKVVITAKNTTNGANCKYQLNGDTGSNYSTTWVEGTTSGTSGRQTTATSAFIYYNGGASTDNWSTAVSYFMNYSSSSTNKSVITRFGNQAQTGAYVSSWRSSAAVTSITLNALTENFQIGTTISVYGIGTGSNGVKATGGAIYSDADYVYHVFTSTATFTPTQALSADILVVAGGGSGAGRHGGGGGAGGLLAYSSQSLTTIGYTCTVGAGGTATGTSGRGTSGGSSQFGALSASAGGGAGGSGGGSNSSLTGGSGGGGGASAPMEGGTGSAGTASQGYAGGNGSGYYGTSYYAGGGGGGAGGDGQSLTDTVNSPGGYGGVGATSSLIQAIGLATGAGQNVSGTWYIAGGGGGGNWNNSTGAVGVGGYGGGGTGGHSDPSNATNGTANTGGGGGGGGLSSGGNTGVGGNGGSGVVIVRYAK